MVVVYNSHMGGVVLCDMLLSLYRTRHRSTKYYMHIVFYCVGVAVVNGWLLYRRHMDQRNVPAKNQLSLLKFQADLTASLCKAGKSVVKVHGQEADPLQLPLFLPLNFPEKERQHQYLIQPRMFSLIKLATFLSSKKNNSVVANAKLATHT